MTHKVLGIHLSPNLVKLVEVEQGKVVNWSIDYLAGEAIGEAHVKALKTAIGNKKIRCKEARVALSGADLIYKLIELPPLQEKEICSALKYKLEAALAQPVEDLALDYYKIDKLQGEDQQLYFVAAAPKNSIAAVAQTIKKAGLTLKDIIPSAAALKNASKLAESEPSALIYIGKFSMVIVLLKNRAPIFAREVAVGGENITQSMVGVVAAETGEIDLTYDKAEEIKDSFGIPLDLEEYSKEAKMPAAKMMEMMRPALEKITAEILLTFEYYHKESGDQSEFKKIYLTGGASKTKNLLPYLSRELGFSMEPLVSAVSVESEELKGAAPFLSIALGAALPQEKDLSLLPDEYKHALRAIWARMYNPRTAVLIYLLILALLFGLFSLRQKGLVSQQQNLNKQLEDYGLQVGEQSPEQILLASIKKEIGYREGKRGRFNEIIEQLEKAIPDGVYFDGVKYESKLKEVVIRGAVLRERGQRAVAQFIEGLKKEPPFQSIELAYLRETDEFNVPAYKFELKCVLGGDEK